jgi:hypothetical protein
MALSIKAEPFGTRALPEFSQDKRNITLLLLGENVM